MGHSGNMFQDFYRSCNCGHIVVVVVLAVVLVVVLAVLVAIAVAVAALLAMKRTSAVTRR